MGAMTGEYIALHRAEEQLGGGCRGDVFTLGLGTGDDSPHVLFVGSAGITVAQSERDLWDGYGVPLSHAPAVSKEVQTWHTGGGCMVDVVMLEDGRTIGITDLVVLYPNGEAMYDEDLCGTDGFADLPQVELARMLTWNCDEGA